MNAETANNGIADIKSVDDVQNTAQSSTAETLVSVDNINLRYGEVIALENVNIDIQVGEFFTLLGPSGCGKTSLLRTIGGFQQPTSGKIILDGDDVTLTAPHKRPVNTVFQSFALFPHMTVSENVAFGLEMLGWDKSRISSRVGDVLKLVELGDFAQRGIGELSGGKQQRVALARGLAPEPRLLLLDEPMSALDMKLRKEMQKELKRLNRETGITFLMVTHDQEEALAMSDRVAVLRYGEVRQIGTPEDVYRRPTSSFVADFIGEANLIAAHELGRDEKAGFVMIRPEDISVGPTDGPQHISGTVEDIIFQGGSYETTVHTANGTSIRILSVGSALNHEIGQDVGLTWAASAERVLED